MNEGKRFEQNFKASVPPGCYYLRLHDSSIGFDIENSTQRFALKSPYDCILYKEGTLYCLELKSVRNGAISYAGSNPKIKEHQIAELRVAASFGAQAGFVFNFRNTGNTYYVPIGAFDFFVNNVGKKSLNEIDTRRIGIAIPFRKLKVNYRYELEILFKTEQLILQECR